MKKKSSPPKLAKNEIRVFLQKINYQFERDNVSFENLLDAKDKLRAKQFGFEKDRVAFLHSRYLLKTILCDYYSLPSSQLSLSKSSSGKLESLIPGILPEVTFSLSRSDDYTCCAIGKCNLLGIDLEKFRLMDNEIFYATDLLTNQEEDMASKGNNRVQSSLEIINLWTLKEAFTKAIGLGLSYPFNNIGFLRTGKNRERIIPTFTDNFYRRGYQWSFALFNFGQKKFAMSIACMAEVSSPVKINVYEMVDKHESINSSFELISKTDTISTSINILAPTYGRV